MYIDQKEPQILSKDQPIVHNHINNIFNELFSHNEHNKNYSALQDLMKDIDLKKISDQGNLN